MLLNIDSFLFSTRIYWLRCVALRCVALRCVALRCVALRCVALRCVALCSLMLFGFLLEANAQIKPVYRVITDASNSPYEFNDGQGGFDGFDVDLMREIAKRAEFDFTLQHRSWKHVFELLNRNEADIVMAAITITPERAELVDFTIPYIHPTRTAVILPEVAKKVGISDFNSLREATISMKDKTTNLSSLQEMFGDSEKFMPVISQYEAFKQMLAGKVEVGFGDTLVMQHYMSRYPKIDFVTLVQPLEKPINAAFAVRKGNTELKTKLDNAIRSIRDDGTYKAIATKWFGEKIAANL